MALHAFVDESFATARYVVAAAIVPATDVKDARGAIRRLLKSGQTRLHFKKESNGRRSQVLTDLEALGLTARIYVTYNRREARGVCLERMVPDLATVGVERLVLELDDSLVETDRRKLFQLTRKHGAEHLEYRHMRASQDLLLCAADALAWCWAKGGRWRARVAPYTTEVQA